MNNKSTNINLESIDWNNLSVDAFHELHSKLDVSPTARKERSQNNVFETIKIYGKFYSIPYKTFLRLKNMKSLKSKEKLQNEIISMYKPIQEL